MWDMNIFVFNRSHSIKLFINAVNMVKMVNGSQYCRALESVSIASAMSGALTIYPCQIRVHQTLTVLNSNFLQLRRRSGGQPPRTVYPRRLLVNTTLAGIEPTTFRLLVRRATSRHTETTKYKQNFSI